MLSLQFCITRLPPFFFTYLGATFGFNPFTYSDNEAVGTITVTAVLLSGILERDVEVIINSNDGSALAGS